MVFDFVEIIMEKAYTSQKKNVHIFGSKMNNPAKRRTRNNGQKHVFY